MGTETTNNGMPHNELIHRISKPNEYTVKRFISKPEKFSTVSITHMSEERVLTIIRALNKICDQHGFHY